MIATDLYEGIRPAAWRDVDGITRLLTHLEEVEGYPLSGWLHEVSQRLRSITVLEREGKVGDAEAGCGKGGRGKGGGEEAGLSVGGGDDAPPWGVEGGA